MGRYIERVENIARLLSVTESFAGSQRNSDAWTSLLKVFADETGFAGAGLDATAENVCRYFLSSTQTMTSAISCLTMVRENARSMRHLLSTETWVQISRFHSRVAALSRKNPPLSKVPEICERMRRDCHAHYGVMEATSYRDEVWLFNRLGASLERADQMTRLIDMKYFQIDLAEDADEDAT
ncbi:MAG: alpha-E domain-containing protein, partial [Pseudomonadota bacterium]